MAIAGGGAAARDARARLLALGARVDELPADALADEDGAAGWARDRAPLHALVFDAGAGFGAGGADALRDTMEQAWRAVRAVATGALIDAGDPGRLLLIAPRPGAGPHAPAARAALENLARTLSVEWARYGDHRRGAVARPGHHRRRAGGARVLSHLAGRRVLQRLPVRARQPCPSARPLSGRRRSHTVFLRGLTRPCYGAARCSRP